MVKQYKKLVVLPYDTYQRLLIGDNLQQNTNGKLNKPSDLNDADVLDKSTTSLGATIAPSEDVSNQIEEIVTYIPSKLQKKATTILNALKNTTKHSWNNKMEFVFNGNAISGSNIVDLVKSCAYQYSSFVPVGLDQFKSALIELNLPQTFLPFATKLPTVSRRNNSKWVTTQGRKAVKKRTKTSRTYSPKEAHLKQNWISI